MTDYKFMDQAVEDICKSMREEPHRWRISTHEVKDLFSGVEYWTAGYIKSINSIWTGHTTEQVFSVEQGYKIRKAVEELREIKESQAQERILNSFKPKFTIKPVNAVKKWWEFWK